MRLLELFCGTKSVGKVAEKRGWEVISLDFNPKFNATITEDIMEWDYTAYPPDYFDVVWGSPDCRTWSFATAGKYRTKDEIYGHEDEHQAEATLGGAMIMRTLEILKYFQPPKWFIENPRGLLQYYPPLVHFCEEYGAFRTLVYYANYDYHTPKPTHIWSNMPLWEDEKCREMIEGVDWKWIKHTYSYKGRKKYYINFHNGGENRPEKRSVIPPKLIERLFDLE